MKKYIATYGKNLQFFDDYYPSPNHIYVLINGRWFRNISEAFNRDGYQYKLKSKNQYIFISENLKDMLFSKDEPANIMANIMIESKFEEKYGELQSNLR